MPDATSPQGTADDTALSFDKGVENLAELLKDPEQPDLQEDDEGQGQDNSGQGDEPEPDGQADAEEEADTQGSGQRRDAKGRFIREATREDTYRLDDGTVITVGDLARNNLFQRDYTRKTEELKTERQKFESERSQSSEDRKALAAQREFLLKAFQQIAPQAPDEELMRVGSDKYDPIAFGHQKHEFDKRQNALDAILGAIQAEKARQDEEATAQAAEKLKTEAEKMFEANPDLRDRAKYNQFWTEAVDAMADYGFSEKELSEFVDHRIYKLAKDLILLKKARSKAPKVKQEVEKKPALIRGGARIDPAARNSREAQQRTERLRQTGSFDDGVAALMKFKL